MCNKHVTTEIFIFWNFKLKNLIHLRGQKRGYNGANSTVAETQCLPTEKTRLYTVLVISSVKIIIFVFLKF